MTQGCTRRCIRRRRRRGFGDRSRTGRVSTCAKPRQQQNVRGWWRIHSCRHPLLGDKLVAPTPLFDEMNSRKSSPHRSVRVI